MRKLFCEIIFKTYGNANKILSAFGTFLLVLFLVLAWSPMAHSKAFIPLYSKTAPLFVDKSRNLYPRHSIFVAPKGESGSGTLDSPYTLQQIKESPTLVGNINEKLRHETDEVVLYRSIPVSEAAKIGIKGGHSYRMEDTRDTIISGKPGKKTPVLPKLQPIEATPKPVQAVQPPQQPVIPLQQPAIQIQQPQLPPAFVPSPIQPPPPPPQQQPIIQSKPAGGLGQPGKQDKPSKKVKSKSKDPSSLPVLITPHKYVPPLQPPKAHYIPPHYDDEDDDLTTPPPPPKKFMHPKMPGKTQSPEVLKKPQSGHPDILPPPSLPPLSYSDSEPPTPITPITPPHPVIVPKPPPIVVPFTHPKPIPPTKPIKKTQQKGPGDFTKREVVKMSESLNSSLTTHQEQISHLLTQNPAKLSEENLHQFVQDAKIGLQMGRNVSHDIQAFRDTIIPAHIEFYRQKIAIDTSDFPEKLPKIKNYFSEKTVAPDNLKSHAQKMIHLTQLYDAAIQKEQASPPLQVKQLPEYSPNTANQHIESANESIKTFDAQKTALEKQQDAYNKDAKKFASLKRKAKTAKERTRLDSKFKLAKKMHDLGKSTISYLDTAKVKTEGIKNKLEGMNMDSSVVTERSTTQVLDDAIAHRNKMYQHRLSLEDEIEKEDDASAKDNLDEQIRELRVGHENLSRGIASLSQARRSLFGKNSTVKRFIDRYRPIR